jgi:hypothetical protein
LLQCILSIINKPSILKDLISIEEGENPLSAEDLNKNLSKEEI